MHLITIPVEQESIENPWGAENENSYNKNAMILKAYYFTR